MRPSVATQKNSVNGQTCGQTIFLTETATKGFVGVMHCIKCKQRIVLVLPQSYCNSLLQICQVFLVKIFIAVNKEQGCSFLLERRSSKYIVYKGLNEKLNILTRKIYVMTI